MAVSLYSDRLSYSTTVWVPEQTFTPLPNFFQNHSSEFVLSSKKFTPLKRILEQVSQGVEEELKNHYYKDKGYFARFFSNESWDGWTEEHTALGKVVSLFKEYSENPSKELIRRMRPFLTQANREAKEIMKSCSFGLAGGALGSVLAQNPLPLILGVSNCWTEVAGEPPVLVKPIPDYVANLVNKINYKIPADTFYYNGSLTYRITNSRGENLPSGMKFDNTTLTFSGTQAQNLVVRLYAANPQNEEAYDDFEMRGNPYMALWISVVVIVPVALMWAFVLSRKKSQNAENEMLINQS